MSEKLPISVHILTWNSAKTLRKALESIKECKEILLIDGGSTDDTLAIGRAFGAKIIPQMDPGKPIKDFSAARNLGLRHATQPWILALDSDETASDGLMRQIAQIATQDSAPAAFFVPRKYVMANGTIIEYASTYPNERIYFFHRDAVTGWIKPVHERVQLKPGTTTAHLRGASLAPLPTLEEYKEKNLRYIKIEAASSRGKGWAHWFRRVLHTLRSRCIALLRLTYIWLLPHQGKRLPLRHELLRFWYGWKLVVETWPWKKGTMWP